MTLKLTARLSALAWCMVVGSAAAWAQEARTVPAGKRTAIGSFSLYSTVNCASAGYPEWKIANPAENGKIEVVVERRTVNAGSCGAVQIPVHMIYYTPKPGFRGVDAGSVDFLYNYFVDAPRPVSQRQSFAITVR